MFGGAKPWSARTIAPKDCRICTQPFQPAAGGSLYCEACKTGHKRKSHAAGQRAWRAKHPERHSENKARFDLKKFGLTLEDYRQMFEAQGGACAICRTTSPGGRGKTRTLAVDHCHATGKVRALLCHRCNGALGMVSDREEILSGMIEYVRKYRDE